MGSILYSFSMLVDNRDDILFKAGSHIAWYMLDPAILYIQSLMLKSYVSTKLSKLLSLQLSITDSPDVKASDYVSAGTSELLTEDTGALVGRPAVLVAAGMFH